MERKSLYDRIADCEPLTLKCHLCPPKKKNLFVDTCDCGLHFCLKHRHHDCPKKKEKICLTAVVHKKIDKI